MKFLMAAILLAGLPATLSAVPNENARFALHVKAPLHPDQDHEPVRQRVL